MIDFNPKNTANNANTALDSKQLSGSQTNTPANTTASNAAAKANNNLSKLLTILKQLPEGKTLEAQVKSSQILSNTEKSLLQQVNPSLFNKLNQQLSKEAQLKTASSTTVTTPTTTNNPQASLKPSIQNTTLFLAKLAVSQTKGQTQVITTVTPQALKINESVLIGQRNQQLLIDRSPSQQIQQAASETIKQILPKQQSIQALQQFIQQITQLPKPIQTLLLTKTSANAIQQLNQFTYTDKQLQNGAAVKQSIANSGVQLEAKINQQQNIQNDLRTLLSAITTQLNKSTLPSNLTSTQNHLSTHAQVFSSPTTTSQGIPKEIEKMIVSIINSLPASNTPALSPQHTLPPSLNQQTATAALMRLLGVSIPLENKTLAALPKIIEQHLRQLIEKTQARIQLNQFKSLSLDKGISEAKATFLQQFHTELPLRFNEQVLPVQITIQEQEHKEKQDSHDEQDNAKNEEKPSNTKQWQIFMSFDLPTKDPTITEALHTRVNIVDSSVAATLWTESASLCHLATQKITFLRDKLLANGLEVEELICLEGRPPQQDVSLGYNLVDIKT